MGTMSVGRIDDKILLENARKEKSK